MQTANASVSKTVWVIVKACGPLPPIRPIKNANTSQPTRSFNMAAATMTIPIFDRYRCRSIRILAMTGSAVIANAIATNKAKTLWLALG